MWLRGVCPYLLQCCLKAFFYVLGYLGCIPDLAIIECLKALGSIVYMCVFNSTLRGMGFPFPSSQTCPFCVVCK